VVVIIANNTGFTDEGWRIAMIFQQWSIAAVFMLVISSLVLVLSQEWRIYVIGLSIQYLAVFWLVAVTWPVGLAVVKLVVGWMIGAVLGASQPTYNLIYENEKGISGTLFRLMSSIMVLVIAVSIAPLLNAWLPAGMDILLGGVILVGMGLLQLGMTTRPLRVIVGLLMLFSGFEILYSTIETSVLVAGLLAAVNLGLALAGSYFLIIPTLEESQ